jgi:hypothetical protein
MLDSRLLAYGALTCITFVWELGASRSMGLLPALLASALAFVLPLSPRYMRLAMAFALLLHSWHFAGRSPAIWENQSWFVQADVAMACWLIFSNAADADVISRTIKHQYASYYLAAGFWKLNSHFWDPNASCGTMFFVQMIAQYISPFVSLETATAIAKLAKPLAPAATLLIEMAVGGLMVVGVVTGSRMFERAGVLLALLFHLAVCFTPKPNDISSFALVCAARLVVFSSKEGVNYAIHVVRPWWWHIAAVTAVIAAIGIQSSWTPHNFSFAIYIPVAIFVTIAVVQESITSKTKKSLGRRTLWTWLAIVVAFFSSFGNLILGLQEQSTPNMFANLKVHGGSNHFLLPTGLLFHFFAEYPESHPFGGGVIRIENTTSNWLKTVYPADMTPFLMPSNAVDLLESVGNPRPSYFNPGAVRVLGLSLPPPERFYRYTVPALEFKRLLREAKERDGSFNLVYAQLPGTKGDEIWRATATKKMVSLEVRDGVVTKCIENDSSPCGAMDLPFLPDSAVPMILQRLSLYHAYPIVTDDVDKIPPSIICFGP